MSSSATPATQSEGRCHEVPRLPHKVKADVSKCHACHAKGRGITAPWLTKRARQSQPSAISATPATQSNNPYHQSSSAMPATQSDGGSNVDVTKCHACHTKWRQMSRSATPATQNAAASRRHGWPSAPPEPTQCHKCHACQQSMSSSATPATQSNNRRRQVPRLPHKVKVDVTKCHACHAKRRGVTAPWLTKRARQSQPSAISATPVTQSDDQCVDNCMWASCMWGSCVWASCVWASCVWTSCV